jgi:hypothetical protein
MTKNLRLLAVCLRLDGPVRYVCVERARAAGTGRKWAYWGTSRYLLTLLEGSPMMMREGSADSDRRSKPLAERDADAVAASEGRVVMRALRHGLITEREAVVLFATLPKGEGVDHGEHL